MKKLALIIATCLLLTSCGDKNREDAITYVKTVQMFLISKGVCKNNQDCTKKQFVFWEGAAPWKEELNILVYRITDKALAIEIEKALKRKRQNMPHGLNLMVYSSKHLQPKVMLLKSTIK